MALLLVIIVLFALLLLYGYQRYYKGKAPIIESKDTKLTTPKDGYDVIIVGAGPSGAVNAYYLAKKGYNVLLLERKQFPRDKYCGDAWCSPALDILEEMGILQELEEKNLCHAVKHGGFISPFGYQCINRPDGKSVYGSKKSIRTYAIKRIICDEFIAKKAKEVGANLVENQEIVDAKLIQNKESNDNNDKLWTVKAKTGEEYIGRMLVIADGSNSYLGQKLGIIDGESQGICSRHYIMGGTHKCKLDGVMFYCNSVIPGYAAIFRHYNDDLYLGIYILPGGKATARDIPKLEESIIKSINLKKLVGDNYEWRDKLRIAPLRLFGYSKNGNKSYDDQVIVIGDAAGLIDPITGEGIHTAMISAKIGAYTIDEMFKKNNFDINACKVYHSRWMNAFGHDFNYSLLMAKIIIKFPILLDAMSSAGIQRGQEFLDEFGMIMTGVKDKIAFLYPSNSIPIAIALIKEIINQKILKRKAKGDDWGKAIILKRLSKKNKKNC